MYLFHNKHLPTVDLIIPTLYKKSALIYNFSHKSFHVNEIQGNFKETMA
jgi:hypothetical protein